MSPVNSMFVCIKKKKKSKNLKKKKKKNYRQICFKMADIDNR